MFKRATVYAWCKLFNICDQACENRAYLHTNFASFFKLKAYTSLHLLNEIFRTYSKIDKELYKLYRSFSPYMGTKKFTIF